MKFLIAGLITFFSISSFAAAIKVEWNKDVNTIFIKSNAGEFTHFQYAFVLTNTGYELTGNQNTLFLWHRYDEPLQLPGNVIKQLNKGNEVTILFRARNTSHAMAILMTEHGEVTKTMLLDRYDKINDASNFSLDGVYLIPANKDN